MIPVNELRIGNYIIQGGLVTIVEQLETSINDWDRTNHKRIIDCQPIPLTEEWLLKFGFDNKHNKDKFTIITKGKLNYEKGRTYFNSWTILEKQPDYVHELQNLYFALTGTELTLIK